MSTGDGMPLEERRQEHPFLDEPWCSTLRNACDRMTYQQLADQAGYGRSKIAEIMSGRRRPSIEELLHISDVLRLSSLRMLDIAGHIPGVSNLLAYVDQLEEQVASKETARASYPLSGAEGAAAIASKALGMGKYVITLEPLWQGTGRNRLHYSDLVAFNPIDPDQASSMRSDLQRELESEMAWFAAGFVGSPAPARYLPSPDPLLVVNVPRYLQNRRGGETILAGIPNSVCVIGGHWSGSADVGSALAYAFDYDYAHVGLAASRAYSRLTHDRDHRLFDRDRLEVSRTFLLGAYIGRPRVWSAGGEGYMSIAQAIAHDRHAHLPFIVHLRPDDELVKWAAWARTEWKHHSLSEHIDLRRLFLEREAATRALKMLPDRVLSIDVGLPAGVDFDDPTEDGRDAFLDYWFGVADEVLNQMRFRYAMRFDLNEAAARMGIGGH